MVSEVIGKSQLGSLDKEDWKKSASIRQTNRRQSLSLSIRSGGPALKHLTFIWEAYNMYNKPLNFEMVV